MSIYPELPSEESPNNKIVPAAGSYFTHVLKEGTAEVEDVNIPLFNVVLHKDGTISPLDPTKPVSYRINPDILRP